MARYIPGYGPRDCPVAFVGEAPGANEDQQGIPFVGRAGKYLDGAIREVTDGHFKLEDCYRTNVFKYRPPDNNLKRAAETGHTIEEGIPQLWQELGDIKAGCIIPLGNLALRAVTGKGTGTSGILNWRGSILQTLHLDRKAVPTIHPAALLRAMGNEGGTQGGLNPRFQYIWKMDLARAFKEAENPIYDVPQPHLEVIRDHVNLERFFDKYRDQTYCAVDIEVIRAIPICVGFAFNNWHGVSVPLLDVMSWQNLEGIPESELVRLWQVVARFLARKDITIVGQNIKFDHQALEKICRMPINGRVIDIMIMAHNLYPEFEKKLAFHQSLWTRFPFHKDDGREFNIKKENINKFLLYNARDCVVEYDLFDNFMQQALEIGLEDFPNWREEFLFGYALKLHDFYKRMESVGLKHNKVRQKELILDYQEKLIQVQKRLDLITGGNINYNSHPQIRKLLFEQFKLPPRESTDEDSLTAIAANNCRKPDHKKAVELILDYRRIRKALGTYFIASPDYDGRMRTNYRICGTETGRSSTGILKPPVRPKKIGHGFHTLTKHGEYGPEIRSSYEADEGYTIVETDMSQAEARIVALLARDERSLDLFNRGEDIHSLTTKWIFNLTEDTKTIKWKYPDLRFIGKTTRHAGNYDMHDKRLMEIVNTDAKKFGIDISISQWKAGKVLEAFHGFAPNIRGVFHVDIQRALSSNNRVLVNPFGRYRQFFGDEGSSLHREGYAHIPQSTVPDHLRMAGMRLEKKLWEMDLYRKMTEFESIFAIEAHDALIALVKDEYVDIYIKMIHTEIEVPIDFSRCTLPRGTLVIPAESKIGKNYKECKVKGCPGCKYLHEYKSPIQVAA